MRTTGTRRNESMPPKAPAGAGPNVGRGKAMDDERRYMAEDALRTLTRAEEIRRDAKLMEDVARCRDDKMRDMAAVKVETAPRTIRSGRSR